MHGVRVVGAFLRDLAVREDGPTAVEYAVMMALVIVVCAASITALGSQSNKTFTKVHTSMSTSRTTSTGSSSPTTAS